MYKYKVKDGVGNLEGSVIPGHGVIKDGVIESDRKIENPNLVLVSSGEKASPSHVAGVAPQAAQPATAAPSQATTQPQPITSVQPTQTNTESENAQ